MQEINQAFAGLELRDMSKAQEVSEILDKFNLRWNVNVKPLFLEGNVETDIKAIVREDTGEAFSACKEGYTPFQNSRLAELVIGIAGKAGYEVHSGGTFKNGGKVYLQLKSGQDLNGIGENRSKVTGYFTAINSHDGTHSLKWGNVTTTICCGNTYALARKLLQQSARHTAGIFNLVDQYMSELEGLHNEMANMYQRFREMATRPIGQKEITAVVKEITWYDARNQSEQSQYTMNRAGDLLASINSEIKEKGATQWGLFSGVTHYTQYKMPAPKRENATLESKYTGGAFKKDNTALVLINS